MLDGVEPLCDSCSVVKRVVLISINPLSHDDQNHHLLCAKDWDDKNEGVRLFKLSAFTAC